MSLFFQSGKNQHNFWVPLFVWLMDIHSQKSVLCSVSFDSKGCLAPPRCLLFLTSAMFRKDLQMCQAWNGDGQRPTPWTVLKASRMVVHMEEDSPCLQAAAASLRPWRWGRVSHLPQLMVLALAPGPCTFELGMSNSPSIATTWEIRLRASVGHYLAASHGPFCPSEVGCLPQLHCAALVRHVGMKWFVIIALFPL